MVLWISNLDPTTKSVKFFSFSSLTTNSKNHSLIERIQQYMAFHLPIDASSSIRICCVNVGLCDHGNINHCGSRTLILYLFCISLLIRYLQYSIDPSKIRKQDAVSVISSIASNPIGRALAWDFVRAKWDFLMGE